MRLAWMSQIQTLFCAWKSAQSVNKRSAATTLLGKMVVIVLVCVCVFELGCILLISRTSWSWITFLFYILKNNHHFAFKYTVLEFERWEVSDGKGLRLGGLKVKRRMCSLLNPEIKKKLIMLLVRKYSTLCSDFLLWGRCSTGWIRKFWFKAESFLLRLNLILMSICEIILHVFEYQTV